MPYVEPRRNQNGEITSYRLVVSAGLDQNGKQIRRRSLWTPPTRGMSEAQMEREATAAAYKFEDQIKKGYNFDNNQTFAEYAQYVLELKDRTGVKTSTMDRYLDMLPRINEAIAKRTLNTRFKREKISKAELGRRAGVAASTITAATRGDPLRIATAEAIAAALNASPKDLFTFQDNTTPLANKTIIEHHRLISSILAQAEKELLIPYNPAEKATPPKAKRFSPDYYQPEEMDEILNALENAPIKWKVISYLLIDTGCRRGEIMGLKWSRVNFDTSVITIDSNLLYSANRGIYEDTTKTNEVRAGVFANRK